MSQVLVEPPSIPSSLIMPALEIIDTYEAISYCHDPIPSEAPSLEERLLASQLACMASQYQMSEYNLMKFGPVGSPLEYIPMSIQCPSQVRELKSGQAVNASKKAWWPSNLPREPRIKQTSSMPRRSDVPRQILSVHSSHTFTSLPRRIHSEEGVYGLQNKFIPLLNYPPTVDLQLELSVAMSSSLSLIAIPQQFSLQTHSSLQAKTSQSHPIHISAIVPHELLPLITPHLKPRFPPTSRMFDVPNSLLLHNPFQIPHNRDSSRSCRIMRIHNGTKTLPVNGAGVPHPDVIASFPPVPETPRFRVRVASNIMMNAEASQSNARHIINDVKSHSPRPEGQAESQQPYHSGCAPYISRSGSLLSPPLSELAQAISTDILAYSQNDEKGSLADIHDSGVSGITGDTGATFGGPLRPTLGNMLLSSCPGKKVRLSGPVRGRGAICRDLGNDLYRIKSLGVGCIICCLDDEELEFLGAPWSQYSAAAHSVGLDVLRIPIPEGLAPLSPTYLDQQISHIIHFYTLKGIPVLVHCRGGVGRAGLIACCWILKLGLCGWLNEDSGNLDRTHNSNGNQNSFARVRKDCFELVQRVIGVVRSRRSPKAIETYEQVKFLVDFVEFLREPDSNGRTDVFPQAL